MDVSLLRNAIYSNCGKHCKQSSGLVTYQMQTQSSGRGFAPVLLAYLFQWAQSYTVKSPLQYWNTSKSLDLHILITSIWWWSIRICDLSNFKWTENLSRNLLKNIQKESKSMQLLSCHSSATSAAVAWGVWELTVNWCENYSLHTREAKDTWAVSDCAAVLSTDAIHWCWINAPTLNQCSDKWNILS